MLVEMTVDAVGVDPQDHYIIVLRDVTHTRALPIVVGPFEAKAIDHELRRQQPPRPLTHDLLRDLLSEVGARVRRIVVTDLKDQTYYAIITLERNGEVCEVDARPSDAIALALRCRAPIFADDSVVETIYVPDEDAESDEPGNGDVDGRFRDIIADAGLTDTQ